MVTTAARVALVVATVVSGFVWSLTSVSPARATVTPASPLQWGTPTPADDQAPYGVPGALSGISCPSSTLCAAVDDSGDLVTSTDPTGGSADWTDVAVGSAPQYYGVSCPTATLCVAVDGAGDVVTSTDPTGGAGSWTVTSVDADEHLLDVSCPTATLCVAGDSDGHVLTSTDPAGGAASWSTTEVDATNGITGISCPSAALCVATDGVGTVLTSSDPTGGSASWSPGDVDGTDALSGVSCPTATLCVAVDTVGDVVASTDPAGGAADWTVVDADGTAGLVAVSCPTTSLCTATDALGAVVTSTDPTGGADDWTVADVDGTRDLPAVSCPSASLCVAADQGGNVITSTDPTGGAGSWTVTPVDGIDSLTSVSCPSELLCAAVDSSGHVATTTDPADGSAPWSVADVDGAGDLSGVSCPSTLLCVAVDQSGDVVTSTDPTGGPSDWSAAGADVGVVLTGVDCPTSTSCQAVDAHGNVVASTDPTGGSGDWTATAVDPAHPLDGISCPVDGLCVAVDFRGDAVVGSALPVVTGVSPPTGSTAGGAPVTVTGQGFDGATSVDFGASPAVVSGCTDTSCQVTTPTGVAGPAVVTVTTPNGTSSAVGVTGDTYTYVTPATAGPYTAVSPLRICDTRAGNPSGLSGPAAQCNGTGDAGSTLVARVPLTIDVAGQFGVPGDASAVVVNVTAIRPSATGYVTVYPAGAAVPTASNLNVRTGQVVPGLVEVGVGTAGGVSVVANVGTDLAIDLEGYVTPGGSSGAGLYNPLPGPARICDTRAGNPSGLTGGDAQCDGTSEDGSRLAAGTPLDVTVDGHGGVPASGVSAVVLNVTVTAPAAHGYLTAYPQGTAAPTASNLNFAAGETVPNRVIVPVSVTGQVSFVANQATDVLVDVSGWFSTAGGSGDSFVPASAPVRICDTRPGDPSGLFGPEAQCDGAAGVGEPVGAGSTLTVHVAGLAGVPADAKAVVVNVTAVQPSTKTYLTVFPSGTPPLVSDLNPSPGTVEPNLVVATVSAGGTFTVFNFAGSVNVVVDVAGWYQ